MSNLPTPWGTCPMNGWKVELDEIGTSEAHAVCDANGKIVAFAVDHSDQPFDHGLNTDHVHLLKAAPDMQFALIAVEHAIEDLEDYVNPNGLTLRQIVSNAIEKSRGAS
jgi:hypothetical protein